MVFFTYLRGSANNGRTMPACANSPLHCPPGHLSPPHHSLSSHLCRRNRTLAGGWLYVTPICLAAHTRPLLAPIASTLRCASCEHRYSTHPGRPHDCTATPRLRRPLAVFSDFSVHVRIIEITPVSIPVPCETGDSQCSDVSAYRRQQQTASRAEQQPCF